MTFLVPVIIYNGMELGFIAGDFTNSIIAKTIGIEWIGYVMAVFAATDAICSVLFGKLADKFGKWVIIVLGFVFHAIFYIFYLVFLSYYSLEDLSQNSYLLFITAGIFGIGDAAWTPFTSMMMSVFFTEQTEAAFSNLKFWQSIGYIIAFVWAPHLDFFKKLIIMFAILGFSVASLATLEFGFHVHMNQVDERKRLLDDD